ncbi:hypothetical protein [Streptomyces sp. C]|nr:hypothetical protein [Streptomyces sp. C]
MTIKDAGTEPQHFKADVGGTTAQRSPSSQRPPARPARGHPEQQRVA